MLEYLRYSSPSSGSLWLAYSSFIDSSKNKGGNTFVGEDPVRENKQWLTFILGIDRKNPFPDSITHIQDFLVACDTEPAMFEIGQGLALGIPFHNDHHTVLISTVMARNTSDDHRWPF